MAGEASEFEYVRATFEERESADGDFEERVTFRYKVRSNPTAGVDRHDEDVTGWSDEDIQKLGADLVGCRPEDVEVRR